MFAKRKQLSTIIALSATLLASSSTYAAIEEIIVTANKMSESANDVGLAISAVSGDKIAEQKLTSIEDIAFAVPGLVFSSSTGNTPIITLRGVGFNESSVGVYPATSIYIDEAPLPFPVMASHTAYDLERVEVLKGPQGILFGQNSTGGAVNFIAAKPTQDFSYGGDVSYSRFNKKEINGFVSGPLTDDLSARLAITTVDSDGWQKSASRSDENGAEEYTAARLTLAYEPNETTRLSLNVNGWTDKTEPQAQQYAAVNPQIPFDPALGGPPANLAPLLAAPFTKKDPRVADWSESGSPTSDREFYQVVVRGDFDLNEDMTFTALATYSEFEQDQITDGDGLPLVLFDLDKGVADVDSLIVETRLTGEQDSLRWIIGANYEKSNTFEDQNLRYTDSTNSTDVQLFINSSGVTLDQEIETYAVFGNIDFDISDDLTLKVGARYTDSTIDAENCGYGSGDGAINTLFGLPVDSRPPVCYTFFPDFSNGKPFVEELAEDNGSWRVGIDYHLNDDTLLYANISKGYKSGSFPALAAAGTSALAPVVQESVLSYEAGMKSLFAEDTVQLNAAVFFYKYEDKQLRTKVLDPTFGFLDTLANVPKTETLGFEADLTVQATDELTFTASVTYLDSEVTEYGPADQATSFASERAGAPGGFSVVEFEDFSGDPIPFTPEWTYTLDVDYRVGLDNGGLVFMGLNLTGQSESDAAFGAGRIGWTPSQIANGAKSITENFYEMDSYAVLGGRLGYESSDGQWRVMLWGKNLTDEYYVTNVIGASDSTAWFSGRPRTYGLTVAYTY